VPCHRNKGTRWAHLEERNHNRRGIGCRTPRIDKIIVVDLVDERLERALARGVQVMDLREHEDDLPEVVRELTDGRGPDSVIDAVGMEAHVRLARHSPSASPRTCPMLSPSL
jgi:threonine dehydrogenase-like Zn-dependent dehydrogenase